MTTSTPPTNDHLAQIRAERLAHFEAVIDGHMRELTAAVMKHGTLGAAVAVDAQGRLLSQRLAAALGQAGQPVYALEPVGGPAELASRAREDVPPVVAWFFARDTTLEAARLALAASSAFTGARVVVFGHPELLARLKRMPMVAMGWSDPASAEQWLIGLLEYLGAADLGTVSPAEAANRLRLFDDLLSDVEAAPQHLPEDFNVRVSQAARLSRPWLAHIAGDTGAAMDYYRAGLSKYVERTTFSLPALEKTSLHIFKSLQAQGRLGEAGPYARELLGRTFGLPAGNGQIKGMGLLLGWLDTAGDAAALPFAHIVAQAARESSEGETSAGILLFLGEWLIAHNHAADGETYLAPMVAYYRQRNWPDHGESLRLLAEAWRKLGRDVTALEAEYQALQKQN